MIDTHVHLHDERYEDDRSDVIASARRAGVEQMIVIGTSLDDSRQALALAEAENLVAAVGVHPVVFNGGPERSDEWLAGLGVDTPQDMRMERLKQVIGDLEALACHERVVAIGEIGLDYFSHDAERVISSVQRGWQRTGFVVQIALAKKLGLPVVVHCRPEDVAASDAYHVCAEIIAENPEVPFVMHCYMGNVDVTEKLLALPHVHFSFTGNVTFSKSDDDTMSTVLRMIPLTRMMTETDGPYLTPAPHRGKRNVPQYVQYVAGRIAHIKALSVEEVVAQTSANARAFFKV